MNDDAAAYEIRRAIAALNNAINYAMDERGLIVGVDVGTRRSIDSDGKRVPVPHVTSRIHKEL
jgi:hypothetical protein